MGIDSKILETLRKLAEDRGLLVVDRGGWHVQIIGGPRLANYYPESRRRSLYIAGMKQAFHNVSPEQAVELALKPRGIPTKVTRQRSYFKYKQWLYRHSNICVRCKEEIMVFSDATLDHIIPLSQGGLDNMNNMGLAHEKCNQLHGNRMPGDD